MFPLLRPKNLKRFPTFRAFSCSRRPWQPDFPVSAARLGARSSTYERLGSYWLHRAPAGSYGLLLLDVSPRVPTGSNGLLLRAPTFIFVHFGVPAARSAWRRHVRERAGSYWLQRAPTGSYRYFCACGAPGLHFLCLRRSWSPFPSAVVQEIGVWARKSGGALAVIFPSTPISWRPLRAPTASLARLSPRK